MGEKRRMITLLAFIFTLAVLIAIHEFGHYQVAKWCGVKVLKFSLGFGRPIFSRKLGQDQTEFVISALPFGGFVKMLDEREISEDEKLLLNHQDLNRAFNRQSVFKRIAIVAAGPIANLLLAVALYWMLMLQGTTGLKPVLAEVTQSSPASIAQLHQGDLIVSVAGEPVKLWQDLQWVLIRHAFKTQAIEIETLDAQHTLHLNKIDISSITEADLDKDFLSKLGLKSKHPKVLPIIGSVLKDTPAENAGLQAGDRVTSVDGVMIEDWESLVKIIQSSPDKNLLLNVQRSNQKLKINVLPKGVDKKTGQIGASVLVDETLMADYLITVHRSPGEALLKAIEKTYETATFSLKMLGNMLTGQISIKSISGPVTIATYAGQSAHLGINAFIAFLAVISISLGVLNLLPIPVLDGGHLLYYMVELVKGSPVSEQTMEVGQRIGLAILGLLMAFALYNDINRLIAG
jgi:regulator of sigma E protease